MEGEKEGGGREKRGRREREEGEEGERARREDGERFREATTCLSVFLLHTVLGETRALVSHLISHLCYRTASVA